MLPEQCVSVTDLRTQTKKCLEGLEHGEKYVFVNNKPKAVIVDVVLYEKIKADLGQTYRLLEMNKKEISPRLMAKIAETRKMNKNEFINI
ncbi:MAG: hypothetical protein WC269_02895 [Candidatus Gracilibacteria bacterium]|jgi:hypothetical protein